MNSSCRTASKILVANVPMFLLERSWKSVQERTDDDTEFARIIGSRTYTNFERATVSQCVLAVHWCLAVHREFL